MKNNDYVIIDIDLDCKMVDRIDNYCDKSNLTRNEFMENAIKLYLVQHEEKEVCSSIGRALDSKSKGQRFESSQACIDKKIDKVFAKRKRIAESWYKELRRRT